MAVRWAVGNGNWSAVGTWDGGATLPTTGDTVHADGFTVTIDQSITVDSLRTTQRAGGTAGGGFTVAAGGFTLTLANATSALWPGTTTVLTHSATSGTTVLNGYVNNNGATSSTLCIAVTGVGGRLDVNGNVLAGSSGSRTGITISANATVNIVGNLTGVNSGQGTYAVSITTTCTITVTGTITSGSANGDSGLIASAGAPTGTITGSVIGGSSNTAGITWNVASALTVNGSVTGGIGNPSAGISSNAAATITVNGAVTAATGEGITATGAATVIVTGTVTASSGTNGISATSVSSIVRVSGDLIDNSGTGQQALYVVRAEGNWSAPHMHRLRASGGGTVDLVTTDSLAGLPAEDDVRDGVLYGASSEFEGLLVIPDPSLVSVGVPVDNTVGTLDTPTADPDPIAAAIWDFLVADADVANSLGKRLGTAVTVDVLGAQLAAFGA